MASELRKAALDADDIVTEMVDVPEWGIKVEVRGMSGAERAKLLKSSAGGGEVNMLTWFPDLIIATAYDPETGEKIFESADRDAINAKSGAVVSALSDVAARLSGLGETDVQVAKEELSPGIQKLDST